VKTAQKDAIGSGTVTHNTSRSLRGVVCRFDFSTDVFSAGVNTRTSQPPVNHSPLVVHFEKKYFRCLFKHCYPVAERVGAKSIRLTFSEKKGVPRKTRTKRKQE
jgi:hypothetical protein